MRLLPIALVLLSSVDAFACTCVDWPADRRMQEANRVYLARAKKRTAADELQHFEIILWLKGEVAGPDYAIKVGEGDCERTFNTGEVALVFETQGKMPVCNGNVDLDAIMPTFADYLGGSQGAPKDALAVALKGERAKLMGASTRDSISYIALRGDDRIIYKLVTREHGKLAVIESTWRPAPRTK